MYRLIYHSLAGDGLRWRDIDEVRLVSSRNNEASGVTGILLHDGRRFMQVLEGEYRVVIALFAVISADTRHSHISIVSRGMVEGRAFRDWGTCCQEVTTVEDGRSFARNVAALAAKVREEDLAAALLSFARTAAKGLAPFPPAAGYFYPMEANRALVSQGLHEDAAQFGHHGVSLLQPGIGAGPETRD